MATFLYNVAESLNSHYGERLSEVDIVFASRRAAIYFEEELSKISTLKPRLYTIDKWILSKVSGGKDTTYPSKFVLIAKLYSIYSKYHSDTTLSDFYSFGSMILSDFDMIDRYMVDPKAIYSNLSDTKELDMEFSLSSEAKEAAIEFWQTFDNRSAERSQEQEFQGIWRSLLDIYRDFNELLDQENITYSGRSYRQVAEEFKAGKLPRRSAVFVGLNALSHSEKEIFRAMVSAQKADFIWDYDPEWSVGCDQFVEAGYFIERNIEEFPQASYFSTSINNPKDVQIEVLRTPSEALQAKVVSELLSADPATLSQSAVVLTDESLLLPLLHSIPDGVGPINISMGYPLTASPAGRLFELLISLHSSRRGLDFRREAIEAILHHPYTQSNAITEHISGSGLFRFSGEELSALDESLSTLWGGEPLQIYLVKVFTMLRERLVEQPHQEHFCSKVLESLSTVETIASSCGELPSDLYLKLLRQVVAEGRVDFEGVSGSGLQILGILESRTLDFKRVIILSLSDDNFPSSRPDNSYIPPVLLSGFGMPSIAEKSAIWSYYFYRLLQRTDQASLLYCNVADGLTTGEPSRYILQLEYGSRFNLNFRDVMLPKIAPNLTSEIEFQKSPEMVESLRSRTFSPSALSTYISCPLRFYFRYVEGLTSNMGGQQQIDALDIGNVVHLALERLYKDSAPNKKLLGEIERVIDELFHEKLEHKIESNVANVQIIRHEITEMVRNVINHDIADSELLKIESHEERLSIELGGIRVAGRVDRLDRLRDGSIRIVDYKTGTVDLCPPNIEAPFEPFSGEMFYNTKHRSYKEVMQVLIYSYIAYKTRRVDVTPAIFTARTMLSGANYSTSIEIEKRELTPLIVEDYQAIEKMLTDLLTEITSIDTPFTQSYFKDISCKYCDYKPICGK